MSGKQKPEPPPKSDDKEQSERFIETARELESDDSGRKFERALKKVILRKANQAPATKN